MHRYPLLSNDRPEETKESVEKKNNSDDSTQGAQTPAAKKRITVGTPIGQNPSQPKVDSPLSTGSRISSSTPPSGPSTGGEVGRPVVGKPTVSSPVGTQSANSSTEKPAPAPLPRPSLSPKPVASAKPPESKAEISRRNFIKGLAVLGGIIAVGQFAALGPYLQGSVGQSSITSQVIQDAKTGTTLKTTTSLVSSPNSWTTFVYPRSGDPNLDNDTFRQWVLIHLPKGWSAGQYGAVDPISGDSFVALSRVCVHLWCLWSYVPLDDRGICPCHGSQYIPGGPSGSQNANEPGLAVAGPASLQTPPNNQLPVVKLSIATDGTISATNVIGQIGCGQKC